MSVPDRFVLRFKAGHRRGDVAEFRVHDEVRWYTWGPECTPDVCEVDTPAERRAISIAAKASAWALVRFSKGPRAKIKAAIAVIPVLALAWVEQTRDQRGVGDE